ncbi:hypothetical protein EVA_10164, partial [gut metagenome]
LSSHLSPDGALATENHLKRRFIGDRKKTLQQPSDVRDNESR